MKRILIAAFTLIFYLQCTKHQNETLAILKQDFINPPAEAKPRVWWHWMNGNVTKKGIRKDLEWMHRVGIGGIHNFDANLFTPVVVENEMVFMTDAWKDAFKFTTDLADSLGFELTIAGSPGWSVTGGPWVEVGDAMKKYVWTETTIKGGQNFTGVLPQPAQNPGPFQNIEFESESFSPNVGPMTDYYKDVKVIAYKLSENDTHLSTLNPKISTSGGDKFDVEFLTDGDLNATRYIDPVEIGKDFWIQYEFDEPQTFKALTVVGANHRELEQFIGGVENRRLLVSTDGMTFKEVTKIPSSISPQNTVAFQPTSGKIWRLAYNTQPPDFNPVIAMLGIPMEEKTDGVHLAEFVLHPTDRIDQFEEKAGFSHWKEDLPTYLGDGADAVTQMDVIDLTDKMTTDGTLTLEVPEGTWNVIRLGYGITGRQNHPASPAGTGLEVDKLNKEAVRRYINNYLDQYQDATGGLMGERGLQYIILDSYEAGHMNWTQTFPREFETRRGYDLTLWIPVLTGRIIESREASEKFLWDFRKTLGELVVENHYHVISEELKKRNLKLYAESHERDRRYLADGMDVKKNADIPMSAMWTPGDVQSQADIRESASVAHVYGKKMVAAESMTSVGKAFQEHPELLKRTADLELASGLNRFVIHTSVHQPLDNKMPGFSLGPFGQYFTRQETWAEQSKAWISYLARSSYMLQQGKFVADALVYYGENTNITHNFSDSIPKITGYEYDFVNSTGLIEAISVKKKKLVSIGGGTYSILVLDVSAREMTLPVLRKVKELADAGITIAGIKPERAPSLTDDPVEFRKLVDEIWAKSNVTNQPPESMLKANGVSEDIVIKGNSDEILYVHRSTPNEEIYWLNSRSDKTNSAEVSFRVNGKSPMLWQPQTGEVKPVSWKIEKDRTNITLEFEPWEAYFIVFGEPTNSSSFSLPETTETQITSVSDTWEVTFQENRGAPKTATFETLTSWTENQNPGIRYFSGTATYSNRFNMGEIVEGSRILLDLGDVKNIAEVFINGENMGVLWKTPFKLDITEAVKLGNNAIEVQVTNVWANRLIGDAQSDVENKIAFTTIHMDLSDQSLLKSGLLGPVEIREVHNR